MYSTSKPRRFMSSPRKCAHASYESPGGFTVGIRTRSAVSCTSSSRARSTSTLTRSTRAASTMRYCSAMKRIALALACTAAAAIGPAASFDSADLAQDRSSDSADLAQDRSFDSADLPQESQSNARATSGITAVEGIKVGHPTLAERPTGCTVG